MDDFLNQISWSDLKSLKTENNSLFVESKLTFDQALDEAVREKRRALVEATREDRAAFWRDLFNESEVPSE